MFLFLLVAIAGTCPQRLSSLPEKGSSEPLLVNYSLQCWAIALEKQNERTQRDLFQAVYTFH